MLSQILLDECPYGDRSEARVILSLERGIDPYDWDFRLAPQWTLSKCCRWEPVDRPIMSEIVRELHITGSPEGQDRHGLPPGPRSSWTPQGQDTLIVFVLFCFFLLALVFH